MKRQAVLLDAIDTFSGGVPIPHALALTYGYDGDIANERLWLPLIERYGVRHPLVIADGVRRNAGEMLGVHVAGAARAFGLFHPKLLLAVREEAVLAIVGSANLTRGGLGANLELASTLTFGDVEGAAPPAVLEQILDFLSEHVRRVLGRTLRKETLAVYDETLAAAREVHRQLRPRGRAPALSFTHSMSRPIWEQLLDAHGDDPVRRVVVVSPFLEADSVGGEDADDEEDPSDDGSLFRHVLDGNGMQWARRIEDPRCVVFAGALGRTMLPVTVIDSLRNRIELRLQETSIEPRKLHGKLVALCGAKRTTLLWGSPNFTPSALLRQKGGNVECGLILTVPSDKLGEEKVVAELGLIDPFPTFTKKLPAPTVRAHHARPKLDVADSLYDPHSGCLGFSGQVFDNSIRNVEVCLLHDDGSISEPIAQAAVDDDGVFEASDVMVDIEVADSATGKQRLKSLHLLAIGRAADGSEVERTHARLNVRFEDALEVRDNLLLGADAVAADALLVPFYAPPEKRTAAVDAKIAQWKAERVAGGAPSSHHAQLDVFQRNVQRGLWMRVRTLEARNGARFALLQWSAEMRRAVKAMDGSTLPGPCRAYFVEKVSDHVATVLKQIPAWHDPPGPVFQTLSLRELGSALSSISVDDCDIRDDWRASVATLRDATVKRLERLAS